jgi:serine/threonine protein phosphatase PrpC
MEDQHNIVFDANANIPDLMLFGVYDGHGGDAAAIFCHKNIPEKFSKLSDPWNDEQIKAAIAEIDEDFRNEIEDQSVGTTLVITLVKPSKDQKQFELKIVNVGDSRAMIVRNDGKIEPLTQDHKPELPAEHQRIKNAGGHVAMNRVDRNLAISRAIGDFSYKNNDKLKADEQKVISVPDITTSTANPGDFLFICCDGLFEKLSNDDVGNFIYRDCQDLNNKDGTDFDLYKVVSKLVDHSVKQGSNDNHTGLLIQFIDGRGYPGSGSLSKHTFEPGGYQQFSSDVEWAKTYMDDAKKSGLSESELRQLIKSNDEANKDQYRPPQSHSAQQVLAKLGLVLAKQSIETSIDDDSPDN